MKFLQRQYDKLEKKVIRLVRAVNPQALERLDSTETATPYHDATAAVSHATQNGPKITQFVDVLEDKFRAYDPLVARIFVYLSKVAKAIYRFMLCKETTKDGDSNIP